MTTGEDAARQALRESLETNKVEVHLAEETIQVIRHELRAALNELIETQKNQQLICRVCSSRR